MPDHPKESASARYRRLAGECWEIAHTFPAGNWAQNRRIFAQRSERSLKIRRCAIGETLARFLVRDIMADSDVAAGHGIASRPRGPCNFIRPAGGRAECFKIDAHRLAEYSVRGTANRLQIQSISSTC
jgi:hypothetical protein